MAIMDTNSENNQYQYIQDTSLASLDSKTSPLAMLVRTCSQIGADPPMAAAAKSKKPAAATAPVSVPAADRPHSASPAAASAYHAATSVGGGGGGGNSKRNHNNNYIEDHHHQHQHHHQLHHPKPAKLNFKPYENTVLTHDDGSDGRPRSSSSDENGGGGHGKKRKSASPRDADAGTATAKSSRRSSSSSSSTSSAVAATATEPSSDPSTNPIIRSGLEVMHGAKGFCPPPPVPAHSPYKPDALAAFRQTYLPGAPWMPAAVSLAAAAAAAGGKPPSSGDCKDPMCSPGSGCASQSAAAHAHAAAAAAAGHYHHHPAMMGASCPAGCGQCDHQRYLASLMAAAVPFYAPVARPYTCSWVMPGSAHSADAASSVPSLCGKSFGSSDELLQHIRTHTSGSSAAAAAMAAMAAATGPMSPNSTAAAAAFSAYNSHLSRHLFHGHHAPSPYGKPPVPPHMMPPSPYSAFNPTAAYYPAAAYHHPLYSPRGDTSAATVSR